MKSLSIFMLVLLLGAKVALGQDDNITLLAQSVDGKTVKLFWFVKSWNPAITGFDIKRKEGLQNWVKLNPAPILPGLSTKKKLSVVGANLYDESLLKPKLYKFLASNRTREIDPVKYLQKLNTDPYELQEISRIMEEDYGIAMLNGFGYIDHTLTKKSPYQYGLFIQGTDKLLAKTDWNYGEIPDLDVVQELTAKGSPDTRGIKVMWTAELPKMRNAHVAGFNIYRDGIRLNTTRITPDDAADPSQFSWFDQSANGSSQIQYSIAAESVFDIEGIIRSYAYDPADHPKEYKKTEVTEIASLGFYFKEGTSIKWNFPKDYERFIKGFYIEKENVPGVYKTVSGLLEPGTRTYTDKSVSQVNGYIKMRVRTLYKDRTAVAGAERLFCYFPVSEPPIPQNVKAKSISGDKKVTAYISWDPPMAGDSATDYYKVYTFDASNHRFVALSTQQVRSSNYTVVVTGGTAALHRYCVTAFNKLGAESGFSDTVSIQVPSLELPAPVIKKIITDDDNKAAIEWQYPEISDLKGFRVLQNGKVIATENELRKKATEFTTPRLDDGAAYEFEVMAVSDLGVVSPASASFHVVVRQTQKK